MYSQSNVEANPTNEILIPASSNLDRVVEDIKKTLETNPQSSLIQEKSFAWYVLQTHEKVIPIVCFALKNFTHIFGGAFHNHFLQFSKDIVLKYISNNKNKIKALRSDIGQFCCSLHFVNEDLCDLKTIFPTSPGFVLSDRFTELFEFLVRFQIEKVIENLQSHSISIITDLYEEITNSSENLPERIEIPAEKASFYLLYYLFFGIIRLEPMLESCKNFIASSSMIVSLIVSHILNFFQILRKNLTSFSSNSNANSEYVVKELLKMEKNGNFLIGMLKFIIYLEESVPRIINLLSKTFTELDYDKAEVADIMNRIAKSELLVVLKLCQEDLLLYYIEHYAKYFDELITGYCSEKWKFQAEPIDISPTMCKIVQSLTSARKELKAFFRGDMTSQQKLTRKRVKHNVELEMERLFARKTKTIENLKFDIHSIIGTLAKITLKGLYEEIRLQEFGTGGAQQVEVDAHFLGACVSLNILEESLVSGYVQEIVNSAACRCTFFEPLQATILESIVENKKNQMSTKQNKSFN